MQAEIPELSIPTLLDEFENSARNGGLLGKAYELCKNRTFTDEKGNVDDVGPASITPEEAALIHHLVRSLDADVTFETGFGGGGSACVFIGSKGSDRWKRRFHASVDPYGLGGGKGSIVASHLERKYKREFTRVRDYSEMALPALVKKYRNKAKVLLIDGGHLFEHVVMDFVFFDKMCMLGGCIIIDDASAPAITSAINYLVANRSDYAMQRPLPDMALFWKTGPEDTRRWDHFRPFEVSQGLDWGYEHGLY